MNARKNPTVYARLLPLDNAVKVTVTLPNGRRYVATSRLHDVHRTATATLRRG